jgi:hypothetical protein
MECGAWQVRLPAVVVEVASRKGDEEEAEGEAEEGGVEKVVVAEAVEVVAGRE